LEEENMSRYRAYARLAALVAMLAAMVGAITLAPTAASATPRAPYPPPPPNMVVNKGTVKVGVTVKATGRSYTAKEKVTITVTFTPKGSNKSKVVKTATVTADSKGKLTINVKMGGAGTVVITGKGTKSKQSASASVHVIDKYKGGGWEVERAAFAAGTPAGTTTVYASAQDTAPTGGAGVALAGLGALALAGSAVMTRKVMRRRRAGAAA
jgi:hypothetical protein